MSILHNFPASPPPDGLGHGLALVRSETSSRLTVVSITGELDASNVEQVGRQVRGVITGERQALLDLSGLDFLSVDGLRLLWALGDVCAEAGVHWTVVASHPVRRLLTVADPDGKVPAVDCMVAALDRLRSAGRTSLHVVT